MFKPNRRPSQEQVILVDENDMILGQMEKLQAHQEARCHRAFSVFVLRKVHDGWEILLQQRQYDKYHCGGLWTNTCCSHPRPGELTVDAAERRLTEEMGLTLSLQEIGVFHYIAKFDSGLTENEVDHVFIGLYEDQTIAIDACEVANCRWLTPPQLKIEMSDHPEKFTPWLKPALDILTKNGYH